MNIYPITGYANSNNLNRKKNTFINPHFSKINVTAEYANNNPISENRNLKPKLKVLNFGSNPKIQPLYELMTSGKRAQEFISALVQNPKDSKINVRKLLKDYDLDNKEGLKALQNGAFPLKDIMGSMKIFLENFFNKAKSVENLLNFQPNWAPWKLEQKAWELKNPQHISESQASKIELLGKQYHQTREIPFNLGNLPEIFQSQKTYEDLVNKLKNEDILNQTINLNGANYNLQRLKGGDLNNKFIYLLKIDGKKLILKFDRINIEDAHSIDSRHLSLLERRATRQDKYLSADSIYSNACISRYLDSNGCDSTPKLYYYNHKTHSALFEYIEDVNGDNFQQGEIVEGVFDLNKMNSAHEKLNSLGVYLNDTSEKNILMTKSGKAKIIDLGHASFMDTLKPGVKGYNIEFANSNGPDIGTLYASLFRCFLELS